MLPATIFRQIQRTRHSGGLCKNLTDIVSSFNNNARCGGGPVTSAINCLNRYVPATGFIRISFLDLNQYYNGNVQKLRMFANVKRQTLQLQTLKGRELLQDVIDRKREHFIEQKNVLVEDLREARHKVQERMRERMEEVIERENILTIPNLLTVGRAILSPYIGYVIIDGNFGLAVGLLTVAGISDLLDGQIARRWPSQASKAGSFLDPMADKVLMGSLVISMGYCDLLPLWLAATIFSRDVFLLGSGFVIRYITLPSPKTFSRYFDATHVTAQLQPTFISKVNTGVQLFTIGISLGAPIWSYLDHTVLHGLWYLTGATTVAAALSYVINKDTWRAIKKQT